MHMTCNDVSLNKVQARSPRFPLFSSLGPWKLNMNHSILSRHVQDPQEARKVIGVHKVPSDLRVYSAQPKVTYDIVSTNYPHLSRTRPVRHLLSVRNGYHSLITALICPV